MESSFGNQSEKTVIVGASPNPERYSFMACQLLQEFGHWIVPLGIRKGKAGGVEILDIRKKPEITGLDTITMYIGPRHQPEWYDYLAGLKARRIIFNPGSENYEFAKLMTAAGTEVIEACTLVMLRTGQF